MRRDDIMPGVNTDIAYTLKFPCLKSTGNTTGRIRVAQSVERAISRGGHGFDPRCSRQKSWSIRHPLCLCVAARENCKTSLWGPVCEIAQLLTMDLVKTPWFDSRVPGPQSFENCCCLDCSLHKQRSFCPTVVFVIEPGQ